MERFIFSRAQDGNYSADAATKQAFAVALKRSPGVVPRAVVDAAAAELVKKARELQFTSGKSYEECSRHLMRSDPWLQVATAAIALDDAQCERQLGIIVREASAA